MKTLNDIEKVNTNLFEDEIADLKRKTRTFTQRKREKRQFKLVFCEEKEVKNPE